MDNYDLSILANNDWERVFSDNQQFRQAYFDSEAEQMTPWGYHEDFDYQAQIQYLEYAILREFCGRAGFSSASSTQPPWLMPSWQRRITLPLFRAQRRLAEFLNQYPYWQARFQRAKNEKRIAFYFGDYPITRLPDGLKNNVWMQAKHVQQQHFEEELRAGRDLTPSGYVSFTLAFPFETRISHAVTEAGRQTTFTTKFGELSLTIREVGWSRSAFIRDALFFAPDLRSRPHRYRESKFEINISFSINQFRALWPWNADEFATYYGWAEGRLCAIENSFSWDKYRSSVSRNDVKRLEHALDRHAQEAFGEMYYNFPETVEGRAAKCLRWTRSLTWQYRRKGLEELVEMVDEVPNALIAEIVLHLSQMSELPYDDTATPLWVTEALGVYGPRAEAPLAKRVYEELSRQEESRPEDKKQSYDWAVIGKSLARMQTVLPHQSQLENAHRIVQQFLYESIPGDDEVADLLWASSSANVRQEMLDFISTSVDSGSFDDIHIGVKYAIALKRQLSVDFRKRILFDLIGRRFRNPSVRRDILWLTQNLDDLEAADQEVAIRYVLKESESAYLEVQEAAVGVLCNQARIYGRSGARTRSMITRHLIALADSDSDKVASASIAAIARFAPFVPPRYHTEIGSILTSQISAPGQPRGD
jgi:hypothetical protein